MFLLITTWKWHEILLELNQINNAVIKFTFSHLLQRKILHIRALLDVMDFIFLLYRQHSLSDYFFFTILIAKDFLNLSSILMWLLCA
jgi:hypothetical protein